MGQHRLTASNPRIKYTVLHEVAVCMSCGYKTTELDGWETRVSEDTSEIVSRWKEDLENVYSAIHIYSISPTRHEIVQFHK
jgi:C4-type Zn-finger protein